MLFPAETIRIVFESQIFILGRIGNWTRSAKPASHAEAVSSEFSCRWAWKWWTQNPIYRYLQICGSNGQIISRVFFWLEQQCFENSSIDETSSLYSKYTHHASVTEGYFLLVARWMADQYMALHMWSVCFVWREFTEGVRETETESGYCG